MSNVQHGTDARKPSTNVRWAAFHGEHGIAWRDNSDNSVWFQADDGSQYLLHNVDAPHLQLFGRVDLVELQALLDSLHGDLYGLIDHRNSHRAKAA